MTGACGEVLGQRLLFFGGVGEGLLVGRVGEKGGDELIGELAEGEVDLGFELSEGGRVASELIGPEKVLGGEVRADEFESLVRGGNFGTLLGVEANTHGWSFRGTSLGSCLQ